MQKINLSSTLFKKENRMKILSQNTPFIVKEAYNALRTSLLFTSGSTECPVYVITSAVPGEGKTTTATNLAITFAQTGKKVLLIDSDMRNPTLHKYFSLPEKHGLSEMLAGMDSTVKVQDTLIENLFILPSGITPPNPSALLLGNRLDKLLTLLKSKFDYIFVDTPPICTVTDAAVFTSKATGCLLVLKTGFSDINNIKRVVDTIHQINGIIIGFILNDADGKNIYYSKKKGYYSSYEYKESKK